MKVGRKPNPDRERYAERYGLLSHRKRAILTPRTIQQLDACKDEDARRIILGVSR